MLTADPEALLAGLDADQVLELGGLFPGRRGMKSVRGGQQRLPQITTGFDQEMTASGGGIDDLQRQQSSGIRITRRADRGNSPVKRLAHQKPNEFMRCVK